MENEIIGFILGLILLIVVLTAFYIHFAKRSKSLIEKIFLIIICLTLGTVYFLYYLDYFNIPTLLKWNMGIDTNTWINCIFMLLSSILGGAIVLVSTKWQIDEVDKKEKARNKGEFRINKRDIDNKICRIDINFRQKESKCENMAVKGLFIKNVGKTPINEFLIVTKDKRTYFAVDVNKKEYKGGPEKRTKLHYANKILPGESIMLAITYEEKYTNKNHSNLTVYYRDDYDNYYEQIICIYDWSISRPYEFSEEKFIDKLDE